MLEHAVGKTLGVVGFGKCVHSMWGSGWQVGHWAQKAHHSVGASGSALPFTFARETHLSFRVTVCKSDVPQTGLGPDCLPLRVGGAPR